MNKYFKYENNSFCHVIYGPNFYAQNLKFNCINLRIILKIK